MPSGASQADREEEIVVAAERTFSRFGYRRTSMEGIAEEAGISRAGLYTYFAKKEALFQAVVHWLHEQSLERAEEAAGEKDLALEDRLVGLFEARLGFFIDRYHNLEQAQELFTESSRQCAQVIADSRRRYARLLSRVLKQADQAGEIGLEASGLSAANAADLMIRAVEGLKASGVEPLSPKAFRDRLRKLIQLLVRGMRDGKD